MEIREIAREIHDINVSKGFWDGDSWNFGEKIALIHSEVSEALEGHRDNKFADLEEYERVRNIPGKTDSLSFEIFVKNTIEDELADICIRVFDLCGKMSIDLERHIRLKVDYNKQRPHKHGKNY